MRAHNQAECHNSLPILYSSSYEEEVIALRNCLSSRMHYRAMLAKP